MELEVVKMNMETVAKQSDVEDLKELLKKYATIQ